MHSIDIDGIHFSFDDGWTLTKYDDWIFYRKQFSCISNGIKAVDLLAFESKRKELWLIEVKDYRNKRREKEIDLSTETLTKVIDTLAALLPAKINANNQTEPIYAKQFLGARKIRVILYLLQNRKPTKLFPRIVDISDTSIKFRKMMRPIDPHALIVDGLEKPKTIPWSCNL